MSGGPLGPDWWVEPQSGPARHILPPTRQTIFLDDIRYPRLGMVGPCRKAAAVAAASLKCPEFG